MNLKNLDLDLIWRIHSECGFFGFVIRFWDFTKKKGQNPFLDSRTGIRIFQKKRTLIISQRFILHEFFSNYFFTIFGR